MRTTFPRVLGPALVLALAACDPGPSTPPGDDDIDDELGDGELDGSGPGGIGSVTSGMAKADPKVVEAEALLAEGKYQDALELIDAAIAENPAHARFHYVRGNALSYLGDNDEAGAAYREAIELDPDDALPHAALGQLIAFSEGATLEDKKAAVASFQTALQLDPRLADAHRSLGAVLITLAQYQAAVEALDHAAELAGTAETSFLLAQAYGELGNFSAAVAAAKDAVEYEPGPSGADLRLLYARVLLQDGQAEAAAREFEEVAELVPDSAPLRLEVVRGLLELGEADAAAVHMQWLVETLPDEVAVIVNHGRVLLAQGQAKQAIARFDEALAKKPGLSAALVYKIEAQVAAKQCKAARETFAEVVAKGGWEVKAAMAAAPEELPRAIAKGRAFLAGC